MILFRHSPLQSRHDYQEALLSGELTFLVLLHNPGVRQPKWGSIWLITQRGTLTTPIRLCFSHRASGVLRNPTNKGPQRTGDAASTVNAGQFMGFKRLGPDRIPLLYAFTRLWASLS